MTLNTKEKRIIFASETRTGAALIADRLAYGVSNSSVETRSCFVDDGCLNADTLRLLATYNLNFSPAKTTSLRDKDLMWADALILIGVMKHAIPDLPRPIQTLFWNDLDFSTISNLFLGLKLRVGRLPNGLS